jgi:hypothetical protein
MNPSMVKTFDNGMTCISPNVCFQSAVKWQEANLEGEALQSIKITKGHKGLIRCMILALKMTLNIKTWRKSKVPILLNLISQPRRRMHKEGH